MYDMGIKCTNDQILISGERVYAYFAYNVPDMYNKQERFIEDGRHQNIFDTTIEDIANAKGFSN